MASGWRATAMSCGAARLAMPSLYAVPASRMGPDVRTLVTTVAAVTAIEAGNDHLGGRHRVRPWRVYGPTIRCVRAARTGRVGPVPGRARPLPHVPGRGVAGPRWRGTAACCRRRVRRVPAVWMARRRVRALPLHRLPHGAARVAFSTRGASRSGVGSIKLVACPRSITTARRAGHPALRRCSSLTYAQYARSSLLAPRAWRSGRHAPASVPIQRGQATRHIGRARVSSGTHVENHSPLVDASYADDE